MHCGEDVAAVCGVGEMLQGLRQAQADLPVRGDGDGQVAERFIARSRWPRCGSGHTPMLAPRDRVSSAAVEVVAGLGETLAALDDAHTMVVAVGA